MYVCITGGSGFIGTRLCKRLSARDDVEFVIVDKAPSRSFPARVRIADVRSIDSLRSAIPRGSAVVHLAAEHRDDVRPCSLYYEVNVGGARNVCAVASANEISTIIFTSTVAVYGDAEIGTDELGAVKPVNDYGRTKFAAEEIFRSWQAEAPKERTLVIIRPTVVFGEQNRGNVYNLFRHIALRKFVMIGSGENRKSIAYVENVAAFLEHCLQFKPGVHLYNFADKPDFTMNAFVAMVNCSLGRKSFPVFRVPVALGFAIGKVFDLLSMLTRRHYSVSSVRVAKFCANSVYETAVSQSRFVPPVQLDQAIEKTVRYEFIDSLDGRGLFFTD